MEKGWNLKWNYLWYTQDFLYLWINVHLYYILKLIRTKTSIRYAKRMIERRQRERERKVEGEI